MAFEHSCCFAPDDLNNNSRCFQLLGVDVLLDENLRPWVLEVNSNPSLNLTTAVDEAIKLPLVKSILERVFHIILPRTVRVCQIEELQMQTKNTENVKSLDNFPRLERAGQLQVLCACRFRAHRLAQSLQGRKEVQLGRVSNFAIPANLTLPCYIRWLCRLQDLALYQCARIW